jgi:hypothetical protein
MASRPEFPIWTLVLVAACSEAGIEVGASHPANPSAAPAPAFTAARAFSSGYDPSDELPPPAQAGHDHHHHDHAPAVPSSSATAGTGGEGGGS